MKQSRWVNLVFFSLMSMALSGCSLLTREDVKEIEEKKQIQNQVHNLQKAKADQEAQYGSVEGQLREMNGRIESLEHQHTKLNQELKQSEERNKALDERVKNLEQANLALEQELAKIKAIKESTADSKKDPTELLDEADAEAAKKNWKKAATLYQKYRESWPKGKNTPHATYMIGVSFSELGMDEEAKVFLEEVIEKFPKSEAAKKAKSKLKGSKKPK